MGGTARGIGRLRALLLYRMGRKRLPKPRAVVLGSSSVAPRERFFRQEENHRRRREPRKNTLARPIPMNQLSGPLVRLVRDEKLSRDKNAENQYEYIKK